MSFLARADGGRPRGQAPGGDPVFNYPPLRRISSPLELCLLWFGLIALGYVGYVYLDREVYDMEASHSFQMAAAEEETAAVGQPHSRRRRGDLPLGRLQIESADVSTWVLPEADDLALRRGAGHIEGTADPGEPGNVGIAGHRDDVFRGLRKLRLGDPISLATPRGSFLYVVESLRTVTPEQVDVLSPSSYRTLTLITCYPFDYIGPAPLRFVVRARQIG